MVQVLETAPKHTVATRSALIHVGSNRYVFASARRQVRQAGTVKLTLKPGRRGLRLVRHAHAALQLRVYLTYTPAHGQALTIGALKIKLPSRR